MTEEERNGGRALLTTFPRPRSPEPVERRSALLARELAGAGRPAPQTRVELSADARHQGIDLTDEGVRTGPVRVDGKLFSVAGARFPVRGVTYGTFRPRESDGARFPTTDRIRTDLAAMHDAGFTVVRTYTPPPEDLLALADDSGLKVLAGVFYSDWRYLLGGSIAARRKVDQEARREVREVTRRLAGDHRVFALSLGNEVPADVLRWHGTRRIARALAGLADVAREQDPDRLLTYANYPTAEYLPLDELDFLTFNVFLERQQDFRRYLTKLHHLAGDRPLVLGEVGLHVPDEPGGEQRQAEVLGWQLETALERGVAGTCSFTWTDEWWVGDAAVEGWRFGLTDADRRPRPALAAAAAANTRTVRDLRDAWPTMTVVICAYNAAATVDECLRHTCALDYPDLEILLVDDGSTDATAELARRHPRARLVPIEHAGLSVARNEGYRVARGEIVAYLDSDAYPTPEWPYYLALGFDARTVCGVGGPNVPPPDDPPSAHAVARSPGGPVHVLVSDDRAEHVPGCNMAFWKHTLIEIGGCDPIYTAAGDDVDLCWKVLDSGADIGFHPAALVWHHRRPGLLPYLRQQRGYGRSEALVEARHPDRFTPTGTARWCGHIYDSLAPLRTSQRIYRGLYGAAAYQSVYRAPTYRLDLAHQLGIPVAVALLLTAPLGLLAPHFALPALTALAVLAVLACIDASRARPPRHIERRAVFRATVAVMHLLQPIVRLWGRSRHRALAWRDLPESPALPTPVERLGGGVLLFPADRPRGDLAACVVGRLRRDGLRVLAPSGWEDYDARLLVSYLLNGDVVTSAYPEGAVQLRIRRRIRRKRLAVALGACVASVALTPSIAVLGVALVAADVVRGEAHVRRSLRGLVDAGVPTEA